MKILHTADWHLGQTFYNHNRDEEHKAFLEQLCDIVKKEQSDVLVISGDVYDNISPSKSSQKLLIKYLTRISQENQGITIVLVAGNHDSSSMISLHEELWRLANIHVVGSIIKDEAGMPVIDSHIIKVKDKGFVIAVPYINQRFYPSYPDVNQDERMHKFHQTLLDRAKELNTNNLPVVLTGHLAVNNCDIEGHDESCLKLDYTNINNLGNMSDYDYLALGHIHKPQAVWGMEDHSKARYSGAPFAISFDEPYEHSVCAVEISARGGDVINKKVTIKPLRNLITIPKQGGASADDIVKEITGLTDAGNYIRVKLNVKDVVPLADKTAIEQAFKEREDMLCEIVPVREDSSTADEAIIEIMSADEIKHLDPIDIAKSHYLRKYNNNMSDKFVEMLEEVINNVENNQ